MGQENAIFTHYSIQNKAFQPILMCHQIASSRQRKVVNRRSWPCNRLKQTGNKFLTVSTL